MTFKVQQQQHGFKEIISFSYYSQVMEKFDQIENPSQQVVKQLIRLSSLNKIHLYGPNAARKSTDSLGEDLDSKLPVVQSISSSESDDFEPTPKEQMNQSNTPILKSSFAEFQASEQASHLIEQQNSNQKMSCRDLPKSITPQIAEKKRMSIFSIASGRSVHSKLSNNKGLTNRKTMEQERSPGPRSNSISLPSKGPLEGGARMFSTEVHKKNGKEGYFKFLNIPKTSNARNEYQEGGKIQEQEGKGDQVHPFTIEPVGVPVTLEEGARRQSDKLAGRRQLEITLSNQELEDQRPSKESLRTERGVQKNSNNHHFESPKGEAPLASSIPHPPREQLLPKSGSGADSIGTKQLNPIESPDVVGRQRRNFQENMDSDLVLRENRISEAVNENSDTESKPEEFTGYMKPTTRDSGPMLPGEYPRRTISPRIVHQGSMRSLARSGSVQVTPNLFHSVDRFGLYRFTNAPKPADEVANLKKQHREEIAKMNKAKAVLEQQVELLTMQLHEASEREKNLKKTYCTMIQALQQKTQEEPSGKKARQKGGAQERRGPSTEGAMLRQSRSSEADSPGQSQRHAELQKELDDLQQTVQQQEKVLHSQKVQMETQEQLLIQKEEQVIGLKQEKQMLERVMKEREEAGNADLNEHQRLQVKQLRKQVDSLTESMDRRIQQKVDEHQERERNLNEKLIQYQREVQDLNQELDSQRKIVHMKDLRCLEFEKQLHLQENQIGNLVKESDKMLSENQAKVKRMAKQIARLNSELQRYAQGAGEDREATLTPADYEPIEEEDQENPGSENKFITSANTSVQEGIAGVDARVATEGHPPNDCSFGEFSRYKSQEKRVEPGSEGRRQGPAEEPRAVRTASHSRSPIRSKAGAKAAAGKEAGRTGASPRKSQTRSKNRGQVDAPATVREKPYKLQYWTREPAIMDDGTVDDDVTNMLRRKVADLRSQLSRLQVAYNDLKSQSQKEVKRLQGLVDLEKKKRLTVQEDKLEKSSALMQELVERDRKLVSLQNEVRDLQSERSEIESINHNYYGLGAAGMGQLPSPGIRSTVNQSQQMYNLVGNATQRSSRRVSAKRKSAQSSSSQASLKMPKASAKKSYFSGSLSDRRHHQQDPKLNRYLTQHFELTSNPSRRSSSKRKAQNLLEQEPVEADDDAYNHLGQQALGQPAHTDRMRGADPHLLDPDAARHPKIVFNEHFDSNSNEEANQNEASYHDSIPNRLKTSEREEQSRLHTLKSLDSTSYAKLSKKKHLFGDVRPPHHDQLGLVEAIEVVSGCNSSRFLTCGRDDREEDESEIRGEPNENARRPVQQVGAFEPLPQESAYIQNPLSSEGLAEEYVLLDQNSQIANQTALSRSKVNDMDSSGQHRYRKPGAFTGQGARDPKSTRLADGSPIREDTEDEENLEDDVGEELPKQETFGKEGPHRPGSFSCQESMTSSLRVPLLRLQEVLPPGQPVGAMPQQRQLGPTTGAGLSGFGNRVAKQSSAANHLPATQRLQELSVSASLPSGAFMSNFNSYFKNFNSQQSQFSKVNMSSRSNLQENSYSQDELQLLNQLQGSSKLKETLAAPKQAPGEVAGVVSFKTAAHQARLANALRSPLTKPKAEALAAAKQGPGSMQVGSKVYQQRPVQKNQMRKTSQGMQSPTRPPQLAKKPPGGATVPTVQLAFTAPRGSVKHPKAGTLQGKLSPSSFGSRFMTASKKK